MLRMEESVDEGLMKEEKLSCVLRLSDVSPRQEVGSRQRV